MLIRAGEIRRCTATKWRPHGWSAHRAGRHRTKRRQQAGRREDGVADTGVVQGSQPTAGRDVERADVGRARVVREVVRVVRRGGGVMRAVPDGRRRIDERQGGRRHQRRTR